MKFRVGGRMYYLLCIIGDGKVSKVHKVCEVRKENLNMEDKGTRAQRRKV